MSFQVDDELKAKLEKLIAEGPSPGGSAGEAPRHDEEHEEIAGTLICLCARCKERRRMFALEVAGDVFEGLGVPMQKFLLFAVSVEMYVEGGRDMVLQLLKEVLAQEEGDQ